MLIDKRYITFETDDKHNNCITVNIYDGEELVEQVFTHLGEGGPKYFVDMTEFIGKNLRIALEECKSEWRRTPEAYLTDEKVQERIKYIRCEDSYETEHDTDSIRPLIHFTARRGWINDPNGCIYYDGLYHLYYQHCPGALEPMWDNNHWGHAYSKDLITWTEAEPVLRYPHASSGTGFINRENGKICFGTSHLIYESDDGGYHYHFKCVNKGGSGDPKITFIDEFGKYYSITLLNLSTYVIASSPDLVNWTKESEIYGFRECPEFVKYQIEGTDEYKWVLNGGDGAYQIGDFDGHVFTPDPIDSDRLDEYRYIMKVTESYANKYNGSYTNYKEKDEWDKFTAYAHQNFENAPDGRKIRIAWYPICYAREGMPFDQAMTIPMEMSLKKTGLGVRLCYTPVKELEAYYTEEKIGKTVEFSEGDAFDCRIEMTPDSKLNIRGYVLRYNESEKKMYVLPQNKVEFDVPYVLTDGKVHVRAVFDIMTAEFFLGDGEIYMPLKPENVYMGIKADIVGEGNIKINKIEK